MWSWFGKFLFIPQSPHQCPPLQKAFPEPHWAFPSPSPSCWPSPDPLGGRPLPCSAERGSARASPELGIKHMCTHRSACSHHMGTHVCLSVCSCSYVRIGSQANAPQTT